MNYCPFLLPKYQFKILAQRKKNMARITNILMSTAEYLIFLVFLEYFLMLLNVSNGKEVEIGLLQELQVLPI